MGGLKTTIEKQQGEGEGVKNGYYLFYKSYNAPE
jgi:hypothetical protein